MQNPRGKKKTGKSLQNKGFGWSPIQSHEETQNTTQPDLGKGKKATFWCVFWGRHCWVRWLRCRWIFQCGPVVCVLYLMEVRVRFQCSGGGPPSPCACGPNPSPQEQLPLSVVSLTVHVCKYTHAVCYVIFLPQSEWVSLKCHLTSFFFFSSSFLFFSSLIWARRCFLRSSSAFRSLLSAILSCDTIITPQTHSFAHLSRCKQGLM